MIRIKVIIYAFPMDKKPSIFTYRKAHHHRMFSELPQECEGMCSRVLTYLFGVSYRPHKLNSKFNTFSNNSNCFMHLWKTVYPSCFGSKLIMQCRMKTTLCKQSSKKWLFLSILGKFYVNVWKHWVLVVQFDVMFLNVSAILPILIFF